MSEVLSWSTTAADNTSVGGVSIAEGWSPASVNNALRGLMAAIATGIDDGDFATTSGLQPLDATLTALAALTIANGKLIKGTGTDAFTTVDISSFGETLINLADYAALRTGLGAITVSASSLANPGYVKFNIGGTDLTVQWGTGSIASNSTATVNYPTAFSSFSIPICSGTNSNTNNEGDVAAYASGLSSFSIVNSSGGASATYFWVAIGV